MTEKRFYIDTSAYLGILLGEKSAKALTAWLSRKILCSSVLLLIETERNLVHLSRQNILSPSDYQRTLEQCRKDVEKFLLRDLSPDICFTGLFPPVRTPRSSDLVHLRTARWFLENGGLEAFITLDQAQKSAAKDFNLRVL